MEPLDLEYAPSDEVADVAAHPPLRPAVLALTGWPEAERAIVPTELKLVLGAELLRWTPGGYTERRTRFSGRVDVVTPPTTVQVLASGWSGSVPLVHPQAACPAAN